MNDNHVTSQKISHCNKAFIIAMIWLINSN